MQRMLYVALLALAALLPTACYVVPTDRGPDYVIAPALPVIVELGVEPYYYHQGYYYYYNDRRWSYSHAKTGPWKELPRDRYPRETRFKDRDHDRDRDRDRDDRY